MSKDLLRSDNNLIMPQRVNWKTSQQFAKAIYTLLETHKADTITIDFSGVERAYPNGMVPIVARANMASEDGKKINIIPPKDPSILQVFENNLWLHHLFPDQWGEHVNQYSLGSIGLRRFRNDTELNDTVDKIVEICLQQLVFAEGVPQAFEWALNEIAGNILVHSRREDGYIQVVTFRESHQLSLIVCDSGQGIPEAMRERFSCSNDQEALEMSTRKGVTSRPDFGQGNGLAGAVSIAQNSKGTLAITSGRARLRVHDGRVEPQQQFPPFIGTCVEMQLSTDSKLDLPKTLWGHEPTDYIENKYEDDRGNLVFRLRDYASSFGNRITGLRIRNLVSNLLKQNPGHSVVIDMSGVGIISSSFADELFAKLFIEVGPIDFSRFVRLNNLDSTCKSIVDVAIQQRVAQSMPYVTPIDSPSVES